MIRLTKFDGQAIVLNADWIQSVETTPDTVITLTTGVKIIVRDHVDKIVEAYIEYKQKTLQPVFEQEKQRLGG